MHIYYIERKFHMTNLASPQLNKMWGCGLDWTGSG